MIYQNDICPCKPMNFHEMTIIYCILKHVKYDAVVMAMYECLLYNHYCGNKTLNCWRNRFSIISVIQPNEGIFA